MHISHLRAAEKIGEQNHKTKQTLQVFKPIYSGLCIARVSDVCPQFPLYHPRNLWMKNPLVSTSAPEFHARSDHSDKNDDHHRGGDDPSEVPSHRNGRRDANASNPWKQEK